MEPRDANLRTTPLEKRIHELRGHNVMFDHDLAALYAVDVKVLNQAVRRNAERFPPDFMILLTDQDVAILRSQIVTSSSDAPQWGGRRWATYAFTEQGVAMLSSVLRSARAISTNIAIMRTFVRLREIVSASPELAKKLDELERRVSSHDEAIANIVQAIRELAAPAPQEPRRKIGFVS